MENLKPDQTVAEQNHETGDKLRQCISYNESYKDNEWTTIGEGSGPFASFIAARDKNSTRTITDLWENNSLYTDKFENGKHSLSKQNAEQAKSYEKGNSVNQVKENSAEYNKVIAEIQKFDFENLPSCSNKSGEGYSMPGDTDTKDIDLNKPLVSVRETDDDANHRHKFDHELPSKLDYIYKDGVQVAFRKLSFNQATLFGVFQHEKGKPQQGKFYQDHIDDQGRDHVQAWLYGGVNAREAVNVSKGSPEYDYVLRTIRSIDWDHVPTAKRK